ncbi:hypothetical protein [Candidatus Amarolinea dominans]|uniref:hypothetical protein n=1 Tax=Candidatus Amarolinea dominans TaxID=3140696 RepID=UPI0031374DD4|nr:hypothetical protein [Anaerolineae bacterium]
MLVEPKRLFLAPDQIGQQRAQFLGPRKGEISLRAGLGNDLTRKAALIEGRIVEAGGEGALALADHGPINPLRVEQAGDGADDGGRIESAAQTGADGHIALQMQAHRFEEQLAQAADRGLIAQRVQALIGPGPSSAGW